MILHIDQRQRLLGDQAAFSGDHRHRFADEAYLVGRDHRAITQAITIIGINVVEILARENGCDAGEHRSFAGIDRNDLGVGQWAAQHLGFEQVGKR